MMAYRQKKGRLGQAFQPTAQRFTIPSSTGGINSLENAMSMPPTDCIYCHNLMPSEYGLRLRKGYREWAINVGSGAGESGEINTIIPFEGQAADKINDRLFAVTPSGIYNVTLFGEKAPAQVVSFTDQSPGSGYGVWTEFTNDASERYLFYADGINGIHQYQESTGLWTRPTFTGTGFDVDNVAFVMSWKNRLWMIQEQSGDAYYSEVDSIGGAVEKFTFGSKFDHGGELKCLYSWTIDGGAGIDDYLVAVSRGGDVLAYQGVDPAVDVTLVGSYFIGEVPESRRIGASYGGELYLLTTYGLTSIRDLLQGVPAGAVATSPSAKISRFLRQLVQDGKDEYQWAIKLNPSDGFLQIITPYQQENAAIQFNQNLLTQAWGQWRGVPANCADTWNADYFFGNRQGVVYHYDGALDGTTLPSDELFVANAGTNVEPDTYWAQVGGGNEYSCTNVRPASGNTVDYLIDIGVPAVVGKTYQIDFEVSGADPDALCAVAYGNDSYSNNVKSGDGVYSVTSTATNTSSLVRLVGFTASGPRPFFEGTIKNISIVETATLGSPIEFDILTSFQAPNGDVSSYKRVGFIRTIGIIAGVANLNVGAVYDYKIETVLPAPPALPQQGVNVWDAASWDQDLWDYNPQGVSFPTGNLNMGRTVAVAVRGTSATRLNILGWDLSYTTGGFL